MSYDVVVENSHGTYKATVLGWPNCSVTGRTREEVLALVRKDLRQRLAEVEIVTVEVDTPKAPHPMLKFAGVLKDDPFFDEVQEEIDAYRRELDSDDEVV